VERVHHAEAWAGMEGVVNLKMRAGALVCEGRLDEGRRAYLAAAMEEIAKLTVEPLDERGFAEALGCLIAARRPLLGKEKVRQQV
jgi:hypothetical protein